MDHHFERGDFIGLTKKKEDGDNDIFIKNSELLGIQVNTKKTDERYKGYIDQHEKLVREYSDENQKLKNELQDASSKLNQLQTEVDQLARDKEYTKGDIDKVNKENYPEQLQKLIRELNEREKARADSQNKMENLQEQWKAKLKLFDNPQDKQQREEENREHVNRLNK